MDYSIAVTSTRTCRGARLARPKQDTDDVQRRAVGAKPVTWSAPIWWPAAIRTPAIRWSLPAPDSSRDIRPPREHTD